jgi:hypothetical protein
VKILSVKMLCVLFFTYFVVEAPTCFASDRTLAIRFTLGKLEEIIRVACQDEKSPLTELLAPCIDECTEEFGIPLSKIIIQSLRLFVYYLLITPQEYLDIMVFIHTQATRCRAETADLEDVFETVAEKVVRFLFWRNFGQMLFERKDWDINTIAELLLVTGTTLKPSIHLCDLTETLKLNLKFILTPETVTPPARMKQKKIMPAHAFPERMSFSSDLSSIPEDDDESDEENPTDSPGAMSPHDDYLLKNFWPFSELEAISPLLQEQLMSSAKRADQHPNAKILRPMQAIALQKLNECLTTQEQQTTPLYFLWKALIQSAPDPCTLDKTTRAITPTNLISGICPA